MTEPPLPAPPTPMGRGTLSRQLVVGTTVLVALVTIVLSLFTALASFQILQNQLDEQLLSALGRPVGRNPGGGNQDQLGPGDLGGSGLIRIDFITEAPEMNVISARPDEVNAESMTALLELGSVRSPATVAVPGVGLYRVVAKERGELTTVVGLPYSEVSDPMRRQLFMAALLTVAAIGFSYVGARRLVERSLRPLTRLAATATQVADLPLASGEVQVPVRVAPADADPASEVGQVGLAFNQMLDHVEQSLAARHHSETKVRQFVADASHELRNPLASIRGYAELTRRGSDELPEDSAHALGRIEAESERMSVLVEDLLLLARLDSEPTLDLQPTDVTEIVLNAVSDARAASADHSWALALPETVVIARADAHRLHQVVTNLLANARTHTPPGTRVTTSLAQDGPWAVITVADDGPGVPEQIRDSVFERFTRADANRVRQAGGSSTGLGLAIVAAVVNAHGGQVSLDSSAGHTRFAIRIPLA